MSIAVVTGSSGLVGSEACRAFHADGFDVVGIDNDMRSFFFGKEASTVMTGVALENSLTRYEHHAIDIRDTLAIDQLFERYGDKIRVVIHAAAQPSHDWAAKNPKLDFEVNATGTLHLLEATRRCCPEAAFIFLSTNKVYGDTPNRLPLLEMETRWEIKEDHPFHSGIEETMSIDQSTHSLFGTGKLAADVMVQEYGRYFGIHTVCFRCGCLSGPAHAGTEMHGFLAYLMNCTITGRPYRVFGYQGKQVRDNLHSRDLIDAFRHFVRRPGRAEVYNMGGGRDANCSVMEAITLCEKISGRKVKWSYEEKHRTGDHLWWISNSGKFRSYYPEWKIRHGIEQIIQEIHDAYIRRKIGDKKLPSA